MTSRFRFPDVSLLNSFPVTTLLAVAALSAPSLALASTTVTLTPVADSYVSPDGPDSNFGNHGTFVVNRGYAEAYLRFDLSSLPSNAVITAASLSSLAYDGYAYGGDGNVYTSFVADDSWQEMGITWNNRPTPAATPVGEWFLWYDYTVEDKRGVNSNAALIPVVQGELAGDKLVSFRLHSPGYKTRYRSREVTNAAQRPALTLTYSVNEPVTVVLDPEADAYITGGDHGENTMNYGREQALHINYRWDRKFFLRFNLASIPAGALIQSVKLSATAFTGSSPGGDGNVYVYRLWDNNWDEYTITYDTQVWPIWELLGTWWLWYPGGSSYDQVGATADPAFIPVVQAASDATDRRISFRLNGPYYATSYYSRESPDASKHPKLEVTYLP
ncbi:DNRLRE domain-containing protein [Corallococcus exiguus]|nr:DNRLRE domain-containing protein [Corallococcus exiguus]